MATENVNFKAHFGAFVLETLTLGMYGESRNALREYIQNSFDSLRQAINDKLLSEADARVEVTLDEDRNGITIRDNGKGLRIENAVDVLTSVGASNKDYRRNAGFRGIGRLAGIVFCDTLTFTTKAAGQNKKSVVTFHAKELREKLSPRRSYAEDAASTLESCVTATREDDLNIQAHYFEVRLKGFVNPPVECQDYTTLKSFLSQVSPLPYRPEFPHGAAILRQASSDGFDIEWVHVFARDGETSKFEELFKPYGAKFAVKNTRVEITGIDYIKSSKGDWWAWVGRKRLSGAFKDADSRGIRIRVRNIQIGDSRIVRDIFAFSYINEKPRSSYARFVDWYIGEIFIDPEAAIPNARRDGFEEDEAWHDIRNEIDEKIASRYGRLAYKTSNADQLSIASLTKRLADLQDKSEPLLQAQQANWDSVSAAVTDANELQRRIALAIKAADPEELDPIGKVADQVAVLKRELNGLVIEEPDTDCTQEVATALSDFTQGLYKALKERLAPLEWQKARDVVRDVSGEEPS